MKTQQSNTEKLVNIIRKAYQPPTSGHIRDLIDACQEFLSEVEESEYQRQLQNYYNGVTK